MRSHWRAASAGGSTIIILSLLLLLTILTPPTAASLFSSAPPALFCKCTCGTNSTIIPLSSAPPITPQPPHRAPRAPAASTTCADCTRSYCLGYNLPICKDIKREEDVVTSCFARDSVGDRLIVWGFVVVTGGLVVWAGVRGWVGRMLERRGWGGGAAGEGYFSVGR
ncbi:hypothetical protein DFH27DRAFT_650852 [Peziza echinospora]|nr:hypothetical protein DFH27DRAFT_650852 [Peziza echinospora]